MVEMLARDVVADSGSGLGASLDRFAGSLGARHGGFGLARAPMELSLTRRVLDRWTVPDRFGGLSVFDAGALPFMDRTWGTYEGYQDPVYGAETPLVTPVDPVAHPTGLRAQQITGPRRRRSMFSPVATRRAASVRAPRARERWRAVHESDTLSPYPAALGRAGAMQASLLRFPDAQATVTRGPAARGQAAQQPMLQAVLTAPVTSMGWAPAAEGLAPAASAAEALADRVDQPLFETTPVAAWLVDASAPAATRQALAKHHLSRRTVASIGRVGARALPAAPRTLDRLQSADLGALVVPPEAFSSAPPVQHSTAAGPPPVRPASLFGAERPASEAQAPRFSQPVQSRLPQTPFVPSALGGLLREATAPARASREPVRAPWVAVQPAKAARARPARVRGVSPAAPAWTERTGALVRSVGLDGPAQMGLAEATAISGATAISEATASADAAQGPGVQTGAPQTGRAPSPTAPLPGRALLAAHTAQAQDPIARAMTRVGETERGAPADDLGWRAPVAPPAGIIGAATALTERAQHLGRFLATLRGPALAEEGAGGGRFFGFDVVGTLVEIARSALSGGEASGVDPSPGAGRALAVAAQAATPAGGRTATGQVTKAGGEAGGTTPPLIAGAAPARSGVSPSGASPSGASPSAASPSSVFTRSVASGPTTPAHQTIDQSAVAGARDVRAWVEALAALSTVDAPSLELRGSVGRMAQFVESVTQTLRADAWLAPARTADYAGLDAEPGVLIAGAPGVLADGQALPTERGPRAAPSAVLVAPDSPVHGGPAGTSARPAGDPRLSASRMGRVGARSGLRHRRPVVQVGALGAAARRFAARLESGPTPPAVHRPAFVPGAPGILGDARLGAPGTLVLAQADAASADAPVTDRAEATQARLVRPSLAQTSAEQISAKQAARVERQQSAQARRAALTRLPAALARMLEATQPALGASRIEAMAEQITRLGSGALGSAELGSAPLSISPAVAGMHSQTLGAPGALVSPALAGEATLADGRVDARMDAVGAPRGGRAASPARPSQAAGQTGVQALRFSQAALAVFRAQIFKGGPAIAAAARAVAQGRHPELDGMAAAPGSASMRADLGAVVHGRPARRGFGLDVGLSASTPRTPAPRAADWLPASVREVVGALPALESAAAQGAQRSALAQRSETGQLVSSPSMAAPSSQSMAAPSSQRAGSLQSRAVASGRQPTFGRPSLAPSNVDRALIAFQRAAQVEAARGGTASAAAAAGVSGQFGGPVGALFSPNSEVRPSMARRSAPSARSSIRLPGGLFGDRGPSVSVGPGGAHASRVMIETGARTAVEQALRSTPGQRPQRGAETAESARHRNADQSEDSLSPEEIERIARDIITTLEREAEFDLDRLGEDYD
jgi:hypothetical protein